MSDIVDSNSLPNSKSNSTSNSRSNSTSNSKSGVNNLDDLVRNHRLLFVTGKGGVGKTFVSALLAKHARKMGLSVSLYSSHAIDQLGAMVGTNLVHEESVTQDGIRVANLTPTGNFKDFVTKHLKRGPLFEKIAGNQIVTSFFSSIPGFHELLLLGRVYYASCLSPTKPDLVVVDSHATGHFLSLTSTPQSVIQTRLGGPLVEETSRVVDYMKLPTSGCVVVGNLDQVAFSEFAESISMIQTKNILRLCAVVANRSLVSEEQYRSKKNLSELLPVNQDVLKHSFLNTKRSEHLESLRELRRMLTFDQNSLVLPDLGFIDEPLRDQQVKSAVEESFAL